jgi:hypothetical protein
MPSRRRSRNKNIGNNLAEVSRRLRTLERKPVRTRLGNRIVKTSSLAPNAVGPDEVNFGTAVITTDPTVDNTYVENPKDGLFVVSSTTGATSVYSEKDDDFYPLADPTAQADAAQAAEDAADAKDAATTAQLSANGKNAVFRGPGPFTATKVGDIWFDSNAISGDSSGNRPRRWTGSEWEFFGLSYAAITSIDADRIVTGTLTGRNIRTSDTGRRIEMSNTDQLIFRGDNGSTVVGKITPGLLSQGLDISGGETASDSAVLSLRGVNYDGDSSATFLTPGGYGIYISELSPQTQQNFGAGGVLINGGGSTSSAGLRMTSGGAGFEFVDWSGTAFGTTIYAYDDGLDIGSGLVRIAGGAVQVIGDFVVSFGTYQQGTGAPTGVPDGGTGTLVFRYT